MKKLILIVLLLSGCLGFSQTETPESIVQKQVEAYNSKDLENFLSFYSDDIKIYTYPDRLDSDGKEAMRKGYSEFFRNARILNCKISKRIVRTNIIIDEEQIKYNDTEFSGVAIYEIKDGKIVKVTFIE